MANGDILDAHLLVLVTCSIAISFLRHGEGMYDVYDISIGGVVVDE